MALIIKRRARKPLARGNITSMGFSAKVGGIEGSPVVSIGIGEVNIFFSDEEFRDLLETLEYLPSRKKHAGS
jgi:hypothetical protein